MVFALFFFRTPGDFRHTTIVNSLPPAAQSPPYHPRAKVTQRQSSPPPPKTFQCETFFRITFPYPFLPQLNPKRPPKTTPFGDPNRPKIVPRRVLRSFLFENVDSRETSAGVVSGAFFGPQDGAKIDPRSTQDAT